MIAVIDPGMASTNIGDRIISEAIHDVFISPLVVSGADVLTVPLHGPIVDAQRKILRMSTDVVVCGTNLLSDHMRFRSAWKWHRDDIGLTEGRLTVLGAGWWQYQRYGIDPPTRRWFQGLAGNKSWAVRDKYSEQRLTRAGVDSIHTSCPTLWRVEQQTMPGGCTRAVVTLTDYSQDRESDRRLLDLVNDRFQSVTYWPQGPGDSKYLETLGVDRASILEPSLAAFDQQLRIAGTAYVGLRLHGGIRAMQKNVPAVIISIDNRAREIARSSGLVAPSRHSLKVIGELLSTSSVTNLAIPLSAVNGWLSRWGVSL